MSELNGLRNILGNAGTPHWIRCPGCDPENCACENQRYSDEAHQNLIERFGPLPEPLHTHEST